MCFIIIIPLHYLGLLILLVCTLSAHWLVCDFLFACLLVLFVCFVLIFSFLSVSSARATCLFTQQSRAFARRCHSISSYTLFVILNLIICLCMFLVFIAFSPTFDIPPVCFSPVICVTAYTPAYTCLCACCICSYMFACTCVWLYGLHASLYLPVCFYMHLSQMCSPVKYLPVYPPCINSCSCALLCKLVCISLPYLLLLSLLNPTPYMYVCW